MNWAWPIGLGLFAAAAGGLFLAFRNPRFVAGLAAVIAKAAWDALMPIILKRMDPDKERAWNIFNRAPKTLREKRQWLKQWDRLHNGKK